MKAAFRKEDKSNPQIISLETHKVVTLTMKCANPPTLAKDREVLQPTLTNSELEVVVTKDVKNKGNGKNKTGKFSAGKGNCSAPSSSRGGAKGIGAHHQQHHNKNQSTRGGLSARGGYNSNRD